MSNLFQRLGNKQPQPQQQVSPKEQALNLMRQQGIDIPEGKENDPQYLLQQVMQSGKVPNGRLAMVQQLMARMPRR